MQPAERLYELTARDGTMPEEMFEALHELVQSFGFQFSFFSHRDETKAHTTFARWDKDWKKIYDDRRYFYLDPAVAQAKLERTPYKFLLPNDHDNPNVREFIAESHRHNMINGFGVPLHGTTPSHFAGFSAVGRDKPPSRAEMMQISVHVDLFYMRLKAEWTAERISELRITPGELLRLRMLRDGKTLRDIAEIQGVHENTLARVFSDLRDKLQASTNPQLIYNAYRAGILD